MYDYMTYTDIERLTGVSRPTLRKWRERGKLPAPDYLPDMPAWKRATIHAWWTETKNQRDRSL